MTVRDFMLRLPLVGSVPEERGPVTKAHLSFFLKRDGRIFGGGRIHSKISSEDLELLQRAMAPGWSVEPGDVGFREFDGLLNQHMDDGSMSPTVLWAARSAVSALITGELAWQQFSHRTDLGYEDIQSEIEDLIQFLRQFKEEMVAEAKKFDIPKGSRK
jgi:hypothetical protein